MVSSKKWYSVLIAPFLFWCGYLLTYWCHSLPSKILCHWDIVQFVPVTSGFAWWHLGVVWKRQWKAGSVSLTWSCCHISCQFCCFQAEEPWSFLCTEMAPDLIHNFWTLARSSLQKGCRVFRAIQSLQDVGTSWVHVMSERDCLFWFVPLSW